MESIFVGTDVIWLGAGNQFSSCVLRGLVLSLGFIVPLCDEWLSYLQQPGKCGGMRAEVVD